MKIMTKAVCAGILASTLFFPFAASPSYAEGLNIQTVNADRGKLQMSYPAMYADTEQATTAMNSAISSYTKTILNEYKEDRLEAAHTNYKVTYTDDQKVSVMITTYFAKPGSSVLVYKDKGFVFDKATGRQLTVSDLLPAVPAPARLQKGLEQGLFTAYNFEWKPSQFYFDKSNTIASISDDFVLDKDGAVCLIYNPYVFPTESRPVFVKITEQGIQHMQEWNVH